MRYRRQIDNVRAHIWSLRVVIGILLVIIAFMWIGWNNAPRAIRIHHPPDLRSGKVMGIDEVPPANIYAFGHYIFQQLNRWPADGARDYGAQIYRLAPYLTPRYRAELLADLDTRGRRGELTGRVRGMYEVPGHGYEEHRVKILGNGAWVVWLDLAINESVRGMTVKQTVVRYPLRIVYYDVDPEVNPWGLALDGFAEDPRRVNDQEMEDSRRKPS